MEIMMVAFFLMWNDSSFLIMAYAIIQILHYLSTEVLQHAYRFVNSEYFIHLSSSTGTHHGLQTVTFSTVPPLRNAPVA